MGDIDAMFHQVRVWGSIFPKCLRDDAEKHVGSETADVLRNNFYVDD